MGTVRPSAKGRAEVLGYRLAWEAFGAADRGTLLCLHGGPGVPHGYLTCLADLAQFGYRVVFYEDRKSTRLNSSHGYISYAVFCLKKKKKNKHRLRNEIYVIKRDDS